MTMKILKIEVDSEKLEQKILTSDFCAFSVITFKIQV